MCAISNILKAGILGVERIIMVTSAGCGETKVSVTDDFYKTEESFLQAKNRAEKDLRLYTNLEWTIVRPGKILNSSPSQQASESTGKAILTSDIRASGDIYLSDLSTLIVKLLMTPAAGPLGPGKNFIRKEFSALDPSLGVSSVSSSISKDVYTSVDALITSSEE
jgi:putative NADH-flavin reductase